MNTCELQSNTYFQSKAGSSHFLPSLAVALNRHRPETQDLESKGTPVLGFSICIFSRKLTYRGHWPHLGWVLNLFKSRNSLSDVPTEYTTGVTSVVLFPGRQHQWPWILVPVQNIDQLPSTPLHTLERLFRYTRENTLSLRLGLTFRNHWPSPFGRLPHDPEYYSSQLSSL